MRGWLRRITGSCFSEELDYEDYYQQPLYSGNVAKVGWTDGQKPHADSYLLNYDAYGRLTAARYDEGGSEAGDFDEELAYDANGGVTALRRRAIDCEYGTYYYKKTCDSLVVTRQGNQLKRVVDYGSNLYATGYFEFEANASTPPTTTYAYNANGSLEQDWHRGLTLAQYDDAGNLHRVQFTNGAVTRYVRGLGGDLQAMIQQTAVRRTRVQMGDTLELTTARLLATDTTWHAGPFVYTSAGKVSYRHGDGYVELAATPADTATAYYYLRDHVGSVRAVVRGDGTLVQRTAYYPFGGMHGRWSQGDGVQPLKHGGQELDRMHGKDWYLYQARPYMPALGEFTQVDEHCEDYYHLSPYAFCADNPMRYMDPDGKKIVFAENCSERFKEEFSKSINFLNDNNCVDLYNKLESSPIVYTMYEHEKMNQPNCFDKGTNRIHWNPFRRLATNLGFSLSPTTLLDHEFAHAVMFQEDASLFEENVKPYAEDDVDALYYSPEEKRAITGAERNTAIRLGEIPDGAITREDHGGRPIQTLGATSNEEIEDFHIIGIKEK